jgi:hypothetical protein
MTKEDFEAVHGVTNNNSMICLSALFHGLEIQLNEYVYRLFPCTHGGFRIGIVQNKIMMVGLDITLEHFTKMCENMHPDNMDAIVTRLAFSKVVTENNQSVNRHKVRVRKQHD